MTQDRMHLQACKKRKSESNTEREREKERNRERQKNSKGGQMPTVIQQLKKIIVKYMLARKPDYSDPSLTDLY